MVQDNVEHNFHALRVCTVDEGFEISVGSPVRVDGQKVINPISVVGRTVSLNPLLLEGWCDPNSRETHLLDSSNALAGSAATGETLEVATVKV